MLWIWWRGWLTDQYLRVSLTGAAYIRCSWLAVLTATNQRIDTSKVNW
jgi:hypothetical protein